MPHLTDGREMLGHLRDAISGRAAWVILTDDLAAHLRVCAAGMVLLVSGVPEGEMRYGCADVTTGVTAVPFRVSFLTVPKCRVGRKRLAAVLNGCGLEVPRPRREQDLIIVSRPESKRVLIGITKLLGQGKVFLLPPVGAN